MESRVRATPEQLLTLLQYMETHHDLVRPLAGSDRLRSERQWSELTNILNTRGGGVRKTTEKWKKVWADWKSKTKKKGFAIRRHESRGAPASGQTLSLIEQRLLAIMGNLGVEGQGSVEEFGSTSSQCQDEVNQDEMYLEILDGIVYDTPSLEVKTEVIVKKEIDDDNMQCEDTNIGEAETSLTNGSLQPFSSGSSNNRHLDSTSQAQTHVSSVTLAPSTQSPPATPSPPAAPGPAEPLSRGPAHRPPAKRPRLRSPAIPQAASPERPRMGRRRRAPTPFERAAREFAAVELRRLELEEERMNLQHERDMRALDVERERNEVFREVAEIARDCLACFRSWVNRERLNTE